jgi:hypothetical protein
LGNIGGDPLFGEKCVNDGIVSLMLQLLERYSFSPIVRHRCVATLYSLLRVVPNLGKLESAVEPLIKIVASERDTTTLVEATWAVETLTNRFGFEVFPVLSENSECLKSLLANTMCRINNDSFTTPAVRIFGNLSYACQFKLVEFLLDHGLLHVCLNLIRSPQVGVSTKTEVYFALSNIAGGNSDQKPRLIHSKDLMYTVMQNLNCPTTDHTAKKEVLNMFFCFDLVGLTILVHICLACLYYCQLHNIH